MEKEKKKKGFIKQNDVETPNMCQSFCVSAVPTWRTDDEFCVLLFSSRVLFRYCCPPSDLCAVPFWYGHLLRHIYTQCPISGCCLFFFLFMPFFFFFFFLKGVGVVDVALRHSSQMLHFVVSCLSPLLSLPHYYPIRRYSCRLFLFLVVTLSHSCNSCF